MRGHFPKAVNSLAFLAVVCVYILSHSFLSNYRDNTLAGDEKFGIWNLPPMALLIISGEFKGMVANYLTLEVGARLGTEVVRNPTGGFKVVKKDYDWQVLHKMFTASQLLDPSFAQTFVVAQGWLPWNPANMVHETQEILKVAAANRPWDWQPDHARGFNMYFFLNDPGEAGKIYLKAAQKNNAPNFLSIVGSRLAKEGGKIEDAILLLRSMLRTVDKNQSGSEEIQNRLAALEGVYFLEKAVQKYTEIYGSRPDNPAVLIERGIIQEIPKNPYGVDYCIDKEGKVHFDRPDCQ